ncbi:LssY C-terminal domain-containing protein [Edaphobacter sp. HDX4]|uniref:LssY C-terminal domain-containing protein n=1 Tax=Edaphobacter sp. HDX4 TaxID=2794064 RepID=UPI002FE513B0
MDLWSKGLVRGALLFAGWCSLVTEFSVLPVTAQQHHSASSISPITIVRKPGHTSGEAQIVENGKVRKISPHAVAAWRVRGGEGALVIVQEHGDTGQRYVLRYYEMDSGRKRILGLVPFSSASLTETKPFDDGWAFALSGQATEGDPVVVIGDDQAIPGLIRNATNPVFQNDSTLEYAESGAAKTAALGVLLGSDLQSIYVPPATLQAAPKYMQVFPDGNALVELKDGSLHKGQWHTDGTTLTLLAGTATYTVLLHDLKQVEGVPGGARIQVRLLDELSSRDTHEGSTIKAVAISPAVVNEQILIPSGSIFEGKVVEADSVGWGFKHETASLTIDWNRATLPDQRVLELSARISEVENAQEKVDSKGKIQGIRATGTIGNSVENGVLTFAGIDPVAYVFATASGSAVLGFAEAEILYPAGTELILENKRPLITAEVYPPTVGPQAVTAPEKEKLQAFVKELPYRTRAKGSNKVSDITNLVFIGSSAALQRAFAAAGWLPTDELNANSTFRTVKTLTGNQSYTQAPMSVLLLDERPPLFALSKTTNTFASRHHLRVFATEQTYDGSTVLTSSSTQDIGIAFSKKQKTFIHVIDQHIDNERSKVVGDLMFTGCVDHLDMVQRPWVPRDAYNSTGDRLLTDGEAAVVQMNACEHPRTTPVTPAPPPNRMVRATRDTSLTIRNSFYRGNLIYQGIAGGIKARDYFRSSGELPADSGSWRKTDASGAQYKGLGQSPDLHRRQPGEEPEPASAADQAAIEKAKKDHKWDPPRYELALQGGYMHMRTDFLSAVAVLELSSVDTNPAYFLFMGDEVGDGWAAGGSVTVNSWRHFSNEFSYFRQQVKYELQSINATLPPNENTIITDKDLDTDRIGLVTRQFEYNLLIHPTRPTSRWRPYAAVGPVLQLIALNGAPLKEPAGVYTLGLKNIGLIKAAFDFGSTPPLDGGGIFHIGLQYGAGVKYRLRPRVTLRADWRETWSKNPDIIANSYEDYDPNALDETYTTDVFNAKPDQKFIQDRYTVGVAFTF